MGYLKQLDVENFKSWRGKQVVGPFKKFNCIIGTNGSGKSNVMDALSFVMGERAAALRVKHTKDLIHGAHVGKPVSDTASVTMRYCHDNGEEINFCRSISGDNSEYCINGKHVTLAKYSQELEKIGIVTKARNCLVFQGAVESIAMKNPKERTKMFERISQSLELAGEYDKKKEALLKAKEDTQYHFNKKRTAAAEKKQVFLEKIEAQKYQDLVDDLNAIRLQLSLCQLYHNKQGIRSQTETLKEMQGAAEKAKSTLERWEQAVKARKKEHGRLTRELQQIEKQIRAQEQTLSLRRPQYIKAKVNTSHHMKKAAEARGALQKCQRLMTKKEEELADYRQDLDKLERAWRNYERKVQEERSSCGVDITLEDEQVTVILPQLERYKELKELAMKQGAIQNQQAEKLHWEVNADHEKIAFDQRRKNEVERCIKQYQTQFDDYTQRANKLEEYSKSCKTSLDELHQQEVNLSTELQSGSQRSEQVNLELGQALEELRTAKLDSQESHWQQRRNEVLKDLRRIYPDTMYGRLMDLCSPIHKKYQLAVTKVFGRYMNAIVVSSEKVARDCIRYLKEERAEPETFLPVDYLNVSPLNERLRDMRGAKMVVDVVQCAPSSPIAPQLRKVLQFVCGNALVCDTIKEARNVAFDGPERLKTVALDGTMFAKSGVISGGSSELRNKARHWDEKHMNQLKERKEQLMAELRGLVKLRRKDTELKQIQVQAHGVQTRLKYSHTDLDTLRKKTIPTCQAEISRLESELVNLESQIHKLQESVEVKEANIKKFKCKIDQMEDLVFSNFCAEIGVANIREYEQENLKQQQEVDRKRLEFDSQRARLSAQLEYGREQSEQQRSKLSKLEETIGQEDQKVAEQKQEEESLLVLVEECQSVMLELQNSLLEKKTEVADSKAQVDQNMKVLQESSRELVKRQREVISSETALEQKRLGRHNLLLDCKIQSLPITLLSGRMDDISEVQLDSESESTSTTMDIYERESLMVIDYSDLQTKLKHVQAEEEVEAQLESLREAGSSVEGVLQRSTAPNLKALEKMREVKDKFQSVAEAFDASTRAARQCSQEFEQVKAKRFHLFSQCFEHVSIVIDQIYKQLCRNTSAQAILGAENPDEPYLGGISYNCVAPGKRFMAMDNLSGGEKVIAALALVFAIHSFRPAPFFVLDEVDAALDNTNIGKVTSFIREQSRARLQIIVISLKEEFYSRADALLGVYPEFNECMFSRMLTLDLSPYPLNEDGSKEE
ncbi:structural maintenance of chromosomes protein 1B [Osmerus mordax]|uniref:structural maintenance of chromosomes protein 1B n=1 Tax=Osmerus mordax TaxID=8014 RepID=UPI00350F3C42